MYVYILPRSDLDGVWKETSPLRDWVTPSSLLIVVIMGVRSACPLPSSGYKNLLYRQICCLKKR